MLTEYAVAFAGILHGEEGTGNVRVVAACIVGPPSGPAASRVSTTRQGGTGTKELVCAES